MSRTRLLVVDDHAVVRDGLRVLLQREKDLEVVATVGTPREALEACSKLAVEAAVVDLALGPHSGLDLVAALRDEHRSLAILVLSMHDESLFAERALRAGANGYVMKHENADVIVAALRRVIAGRVYVSEATSDRLLRSYSARSSRTSEKRPSALASLSDREVQVLRLLGEGVTTVEIARRLCLSPKTIESHRMRIKEKLGIASAAQLTVFAANAARDGLLNPDAASDDDAPATAGDD